MAACRPLASNQDIASFNSSRSAILVQSRSTISQARRVASGMPARIAFLWACNALSRKAKARASLMQMEPRCRLQFAGRSFSPPVRWCFSIPPSASAPCAPHRTPAGCPADLAFGGSGHANTTNSCPTYSASESDLRGHGVCLMKRRWRHGLRRRCDGQGKGSNSDQPDHSFSPCLASGPIMPCLRGQTLDIARGLATGAYRVEHCFSQTLCGKSRQ